MVDGMQSRLPVAGRERWLAPRVDGHLSVGRGVRWPGGFFKGEAVGCEAIDALGEGLAPEAFGPLELVIGDAAKGDSRGGGDAGADLSDGNGVGSDGVALALVGENPGEAAGAGGFNGDEGCDVDARVGAAPGAGETGTRADAGH